ncbi:MAG TPA: CopD family protein [Terriglobia bacterium]|nr:CopD family protein [Terriglobia bacterium]
MPTIIQWIHLMAAVIGLGGMGFLLLILIPSLGVLSAEQREALSKAVARRFRWATWSAVALLLLSGIYNVSRYYWEEPWDRAWNFLALKISLSFALFAIVLGLTIPFRLFEPLRARRRMWLLVAFILGVVVVMISAYLRRG